MSRTRMAIGPLLRLLLVAGLAASVGGPAPANASIEHPRVVTAVPAPTTPHVEDDDVVTKTSVDALAQQGDRVFAGGSFHRVDNPARTQSYVRHHLMSFSASTGALHDFAPVLNGKVFALLATADALYVGGYFGTVDGVKRRGLAKLDPVTGALDPTFNARLGGPVQEIRLVNGRLIVGGRFPEKLVALDPATGANTGYINLAITGTLTSWAGAVDVYRFAVDPAGTRLVAIGNFSSVAGQPRQRAFMLDLGATSATLNPWYYQPLQNLCVVTKHAAYLKDVDFSPDGTWFAINSTGYVPQDGGLGRDICDATARFETAVANPSRPTWINYSGGDTFHSIAITGAAVYVQGHFRWLDNPKGVDFAGPGAVARSGIGALDPATGRALPWNPGKTRRVGGKDLFVTPQGLWVGSDGERFAGRYRNNLAFVPL